MEFDCKYFFFCLNVFFLFFFFLTIRRKFLHRVQRKVKVAFTNSWLKSSFLCCGHDVLRNITLFCFHFCLWKLGSIWKVVLTLLLIDLEFYGLPHQCPQVLIVYLEVSLFWPIPSGFNLLSLDSVLIVFSSVASLSFEKGIFVEYH